MTRRRMMPESQLRKTKTQRTNVGARPKRSRGPKAKSGTSSVTWSCLTKQHMANCKEVPNEKLISPAVVAERLKVERASLARDLLNWLQSTELK